MAWYAYKKELCQGKPPTGRNKPFSKYYYNQPKPLPLPPIKEIDYKTDPEFAVRLNSATMLRNKHISQCLNDVYDQELIDYSCINRKRIDNLKKIPACPIKDTKTSGFRWKWAHKIPILSCYYQEHVLRYHRPPFEAGRHKLKCYEFSPKITEWVPPVHTDEFSIKGSSDEEDTQGFGHAASVL